MARRGRTRRARPKMPKMVRPGAHLEPLHHPGNRAWGISRCLRLLARMPYWRMW
jgi:hypothetical protein